jgi:hypothetical protein
MTFNFGSFPGPGDTASIERDGFILTASIHHDPDYGAPWKEHDGHGDVTGWLTRAKRPGELVLITDRHASRFYDFATAMVKARAEGWGAGTGHDIDPNLSNGERARAAVMADFTRLKAWADGLWCWVGVSVTVSKNGVQLTDDYSHALWGIESDAGAYFATVSEDLAGEALTAAQAKLAELGHRPAPMSHRIGKALADAAESLVDDVLNATDYGMPVEDEDHPFHSSVADVRSAVARFKEHS